MFGELNKTRYEKTNKIPWIINIHKTMAYW